MLEAAGNDGDIDTLNREMEDLMFRCRALGAQIAAAISKLPSVQDAK